LAVTGLRGVPINRSREEYLKKYRVKSQKNMSQDLEKMAES